MFVAIDFETFRIGPSAVAPQPVCLSVYPVDNNSLLIGNDDPDGLRQAFEALLDDPEVKLIAQNAKFDMGVAAAAWPTLLPKIFQAYQDDRVYCTIVREKLLNLSIHGQLEKLWMPDGSFLRLEYSLTRLVKDYLGKDRSAEKKDKDSWRLNYDQLDGQPATAYPPEAVEYALADAKDAYDVFFAQEERKQDEKGSFETQELRCAADFALYLMTCWGFAIDQDRRLEIVERLAKELDPAKLPLLFEQGIVRPAIPPRPYKNNANKFTKGKPESVNTKALQALVKQVCEKYELTVRQTKKGGISTDEETLQALEGLSPVLDQYHERQRLQKLVTTEMPRIDAPIVHPTYDILKETGRTSSSKDDLFPSCNIQQIDPRARGCYIPRPGHVICSVDYSSIELVSLAQKCLLLFGESHLAELINADIDPHAYLGSQLALHLDEPFATTCAERNATDDPQAVFEIFWQCKFSEEETLREFFKHYRTFAKPTGLGYPGGLGPDTFVSYAKKTFGISVSRETAALLREVWHRTFPEMRKYFDWVNHQCPDGRNHGDFAYLSPFGMLRSGCSFCAAANGAALQTPTAEGALLAVVNVVRACYDSTWGSILFGGCRPLAFVHDEILSEILEDSQTTARAEEIVRLMVEPMQLVLPDVKVKAEPALMRRWDKNAEEIRGADGSLEVWTPNE